MSADLEQGSLDEAELRRRQKVAELPEAVRSQKTIITVPKVRFGSRELP